MSDYSARTPIWVRGGNVVDLLPLGLPAQLVQDLHQWQRCFTEHFAVTRWPHWDSQDVAAWYEQRGHELLDQLERALPHRDLSLDLWPVEEPS